MKGVEELSVVDDLKSTEDANEVAAKLNSHTRR
jgi:hypothetical protein